MEEGSIAEPAGPRGFQWTQDSVVDLFTPRSICTVLGNLFDSLSEGIEEKSRQVDRKCILALTFIAGAQILFALASQLRGK